jgi:hypothetical protein
MVMMGFWWFNDKRFLVLPCDLLTDHSAILEMRDFGRLSSIIVRVGIMAVKRRYPI